MKYRDEQGSNLSPADVDANFRELVSAIGAAVQSTEKGVANGIATLGSDGKIPGGQLPASSGGGGGAAIGDILITSRDPGASYLATNGAVYAQASYPALFAELGFVGYEGGFGGTWTNVAGSFMSGVFLAIGFSGTRWIAVDDVDCIVKYSSDGVTWANTGVTLAFSPTCIDTDRNGIWIIAGVNGAYARSIDNGMSWSTSALATTERMESIKTDRAGVWIVAGHGGKMFRSSNHGVSWSLVDCKFTASGKVYTLCTNRAGVWLAVGMDGKIGVSEDNGLSWYSFYGPVYGVSSVIYDFNGAWIIVGTDALVYRSTDLFNTSTQMLIGQSSEIMNDIATDEAGNILIVCNATSQFMSTDYGVSWEKTASNGGQVVVAGNTGEWVIGASGKMMKSIPSLPYNKNTSFAMPIVAAPAGLKAYIKAL